MSISADKTIVVGEEGIPSLFGGIGDVAIGSNANGLDVLRYSVYSTHNTLIVSLEKHGHPREDIDKRQELIARQMFPQCYSHFD